MKNTKEPTSLHRVKRLYYTLIEILLVFMLIAVVGGGVAFNVRHLVQQQKFQNEVALIVDALNRAQQLMLIYGQNVRVNFQVVEKGILCSLESDCLLDPQWEKWTNRYSSVLKEIHSLNFHDLTFPPNGSAIQSIRFYPNGGGISRGVISLSSAKEIGVKDAFEAHIALEGYPKTIVAVSTIPTLSPENPDPQISMITRNEVLERVVNEK